MLTRARTDRTYHHSPTEVTAEELVELLVGRLVVCAQAAEQRGVDVVMQCARHRLAVHTLGIVVARGYTKFLGIGSGRVIATDAHAGFERVQHIHDTCFAMDAHAGVFADIDRLEVEEAKRLIHNLLRPLRELIGVDHPQLLAREDLEGCEWTGVKV